ncbi:hypothetical protein GCM10007301_27260 [Azorhizobium oxalatiphilum]|uniref:Uncharacterized protein n=1 Tax=Azorhizobium oxalatiphilum TaxID=980631 RepID=A0A917C0P0_9HYPH|nr:hypothetical protein GCM10007301_27260 [Azorhizobium oxalatiphilum]
MQNVQNPFKEVFGFARRSTRFAMLLNAIALPHLAQEHQRRICSALHLSFDEQLIDKGKGHASGARPGRAGPLFGGPCPSSGRVQVLARIGGAPMHSCPRPRTDCYSMLIP